MINVANAVSKWQRNTAGATETFKQAIMGLNENPMQLAAQQAQKALNNYQESINSGRWAKRLQDVPFEQWKQVTSTVGAQRLASGVQKGLPKMQKHLQEWAPTYEQAKQAARAIPNDSKAGALARVAAVYDILRQRAGKPT